MCRRLPVVVGTTGYRNMSYLTPNVKFNRNVILTNINIVECITHDVVNISPHCVMALKLITIESISAAVMVLFELGVLMRVFTRPAFLFWPSLILAPLIAVLAIRLAPLLSELLPSLYATTRLDFAAVFVVAVLLETPLSIIGYPIQPAASFFERLVVAGSFAVVVSMTGKSLYSLIPK